MNKCFESVNCEICSNEYSDYQLENVKLASFSRTLSVCSDCISKSPLKKYQDAANIIINIKSVALDRSGSPEQRLAKIKLLLGE